MDRFVRFSLDLLNLYNRLFYSEHCTKALHSDSTVIDLLHLCIKGRRFNSVVSRWSSCYIYEKLHVPQALIITNEYLDPVHKTSAVLSTVHTIHTFTHAKVLKLSFGYLYGTVAQVHNCLFTSAQHLTWCHVSTDIVQQNVGTL